MFENVTAGTGCSAVGQYRKSFRNLAVGSGWRPAIAIGLVADCSVAEGRCYTAVAIRHTAVAASHWRRWERCSDFDQTWRC